MGCGTPPQVQPVQSSSAEIVPKPEVVTGNIRLLGDRILLKPLPWDGEDVHGAGTRIAVVRHGRPVRGEVVAVGPGRNPFVRKGKSADGRTVRVGYSKHFQPTEVKVGDIVELGGLNVFDGKGYQFPEIIYNGEKHIIATERDVAMVVERE